MEWFIPQKTENAPAAPSFAHQEVQPLSSTLPPPPLHSSQQSIPPAPIAPSLSSYPATPLPVQPQRAKQGRTAADLYAQRTPAVHDTAGIQQPNSHPVQEPDYTPAPIYQEPVTIVVWFHS